MKTILAILALVAATANAQVSSGLNVRRFQWGVESWVSAQQDLTIQIVEPQPVSILSIEGNITASPNASFNLNDNINRETLVTLVNEGVQSMGNVIALTHPAGTNHGVTQHIFAINAKVTGSNAVVVPLSLHFEDNPIRVPANRLTLHVDNSSYRASLNGAGYRDDSYPSGIDTEIQLTVTYRVGP